MEVPSSHLLPRTSSSPGSTTKSDVQSCSSNHSSPRRSSPRKRTQVLPFQGPTETPSSKMQIMVPSHSPNRRSSPRKRALSPGRTVRPYSEIETPSCSKSTSCSPPCRTSPRKRTSVQSGSSTSCSSPSRSPPRKRAQVAPSPSSPTHHSSRRKSADVLNSLHLAEGMSRLLVRITNFYKK